MDNWAKDVKVNLVIQLGFHDATSHAATAIDIVPSQVCDDTVGAKDSQSKSKLKPQDPSGFHAEFIAYPVSPERCFKWDEERIPKIRTMALQKVLSIVEKNMWVIKKIYDFRNIV